MKSILFVIPSLEVGGTISSLSSIIECYKNRYQISVFPIAYEGNLNVEFRDLLLPRRTLVHAYNCTYKNTRGGMRLMAFLFKIIKRIFRFCHYNIETKLYSSLATNFNDKYDVVVGFQEGNATLFASFVSSPHKIAWVHCDYHNYPLSGCEIKIYSRYDDVVCVSKYTADRFKDVYPSLSKKVFHIYNLIDLDRIKSRSLVEIDDPVFKTDKFTLISIGRLHSVKRFECIPQIAKQLVDSNCRFRWYILGPHFSDSIYRELIDSISDNALSEYVFYVGNKTNPYPYLAQSSLLVSLSTTEACPMIFNEAKALGVPILTTDFGSAFEFIDNGKNGIIVPFEKITSTLENLINSPAKVEALKGANDLVDFNNVIIDSVDQLFM